MTNFVHPFLYLLVCMHLLTKLILISSSSQQEYQNTFLMFSPSNIITNIDEIPFIGTTMALRSVIKFVNLVLIFCGSFNECAIVLHPGKLSEKLSNKKTNRLIINGHQYHQYYWLILLWLFQVWITSTMDSEVELRLVQVK